MDTPSESTGTLSVDGAAQVFSSLIDPPPKEAPEGEGNNDLETEAPEATEQEAQEPEVEASDDDDSKITIEVDGKVVELSKAELADYYKNGLRQSDYTKKTMEVAEQRKAAQAEIAKAQAERAQAQQGLAQAQAVLTAQLQEFQNLDWNALAQADPAKWVEMRNLYEQRQAAFNQNMQHQQQLDALQQADQAKLLQTTIQEQQEALLAKLPEWKDATKAAAEKQAIAKYLLDAGYDPKAVNNLVDHRTVILARKAMLFDQTMQKANAAAKKVQAAPQRVVRSGTGDTNRPDGRTAAMQRLGKSGRVEDAAAVFAQFI